MHENSLKMNDGKTEFIILEPRNNWPNAKQLALMLIRLVSNSEVVKYLGTWMDCNLAFKDPTVKKCRTAMINLQ